MCVREREREGMRESVCVCVREREREIGSVVFFVMPAAKELEMKQILVTLVTL